MTAPILTPEEQLHVDATGVHDLDVLAEMEEHADEVLECVVPGCVQEAVTRVVLRCCRRREDLCAQHYEGGRRAAIDLLLLSVLTGGLLVCKHCGQKFPSGAAFDDLYQVVPL